MCVPVVSLLLRLKSMFFEIRIFFPKLQFFRILAYTVTESYKESHSQHKDFFSQFKSIHFFQCQQNFETLKIGFKKFVCDAQCQIGFFSRENFLHYSVTTRKLRFFSCVRNRLFFQFCFQSICFSMSIKKFESSTQFDQRGSYTKLLRRS